MKTKSNEQEVYEASKDLFKILTTAFSQIPQIQAIGIIGNLLMDVGPYTYDLFKRIVHDRSLQLPQVPSPTMREMEIFFATLKQSNPNFYHGVIEFSIDHLDSPRDVYKELRRIYRDLAFGTNGTVLSMLWANTVPPIQKPFDILAKKNEIALEERVYEVLLRETQKNLLLQINDDTLEDIVEALTKLQGLDLSSQKVRESVGERLSRIWQKFYKED